MRFYQLVWGEGSPTNIDVLKTVVTLILTSLLEDLGVITKFRLFLANPSREVSDLEGSS